MNLDYYRTRRTLKDPVSMEGRGLHTGEETEIQIAPAPSGNGITFRRVDRENSTVIPCQSEQVTNSRRNTTIGTEGVQIKTVEHLLSALYGLGVTDVRVDVDGPEVPAVDGSARPFVDALDRAGLESLDENRSVHHVEEPVSVVEGNSSVSLVPSPLPRVDYIISYENPAIGDQFFSFELTPDAFREDIAPARTYGFKEEVQELLDEGLAQGGNFENALVVDEDGDFPGATPRLEKEFVRHKILDLLGDCALSGHFLVGRIIGVMGGHALNHDLVDELDLLAPGNQPSTGGEDGKISNRVPLDVEEIREVLPHRYPFLLLDRIVSIDPEETVAVGYKNVTINEEYFQGHFPDDPIMPGVLLIEAMAQLGAACLLSQPRYEGKNFYFMGLDDVKWRKPVRPGDRVYFEVEGKRLKFRYGLVEGRALVEGELAAEGLYKFALVDQ